MASLTAAYQLTRTEALRAKHEVTVYQIGWRLGGKGATGRRDGRIEEHGLHIWFGYYDNAFRMLREVFRDGARDADHALKTWRDAFKPHSFTPIGPDFFPVNWPTNAAVPGDGHVFWTPWQAFTQLLDMVAATLRTWHESREQLGQPHASPVTVSPRVREQLVESGALTALQGRDFSHAHHALDAAANWARAIGDTHHGPLNHHLRSLSDLVGQTHLAFAASVPAIGADTEQGVVRDMLDILRGFVHGFVHDFLIDGKTARDVDAAEFRAWLVSHGTSPEVAAGSFITRALYDTMFQYEDGDLQRPSYAAGTAVQVVLRMFGCCKGAALWEMQAGMGEVVVSPLVQLLKSRGVQFRFFREVTQLALDATCTRVAQIHLTVQAETHGAEYVPTFKEAGLDCWPAQPFWDQLKDGDRLRAAGVNFESPWSAYAPAGHEVLHEGADFDEVVLGICLGAFKKLNADPTLADQLTAANPAFRAMTENIGLLPSMAMQLWSPKTLPELGWKLPKPATVAGALPLDIWADMTQTLAFERASGKVTPKSVHYFTGVMASSAFRNPRSAHTTQHDSEAALLRICESWLTTEGPRMWPNATHADGSFDWNVLLAEPGVTGAARLQAQYVRANVSPAECCVISAAGKTRFRLKAQASGFANLKLAGTWVDTGFNTECIEAAVMSGMQAARAICGEPVHVLGEDLLQRPGHGLGGWAAPLQILEEAAEFIEGGVRNLQKIARWVFGDRRPQGPGSDT